jgi:hypothetical protein
MASNEVVGLVALSILIAHAVSGTGTPPQPDWSARWILVVALPSDADVPTELTVRQSIRRTTLRGEPMTPYYDQITIEHESGNGAQGTFTIGTNSGTVSGTPTRPRHTERTVGWDHADGRTLVFEQRAYTGDAWDTSDWTASRETWTLEPNGELAITITTRGSAVAAHTRSAVYRRN